MCCRHPVTMGRPTGLQNNNLDRKCQPYVITERQNTSISDQLPHLAHLPSSGVEVKSAEVALQ